MQIQKNNFNTFLYNEDDDILHFCFCFTYYLIEVFLFIFLISCDVNYHLHKLVEINIYNITIPKEINILFAL